MCGGFFEKDRDLLVCILLGLGIVSYLGLSLPGISLPGIYYDEILHAPAAIALMLGNGQRYGSGITIGRWRFPVMIVEYVGALKAYLLLPAFLLLGPGVLAQRLTMILITLGGIFFTARLSRQAHGLSAALASAWLIATDPTLILTTRGDWGPVAIAFTLRAGALYYSWRWWQSGGKRTGALVTAGLMLGLGVYDKASFLWFVFALTGVGVIAWLLSRNRPRLEFRQLAIVVAAAIGGSLPFWLYNLARSWITFRLITLPGENVSLVRLVELVPQRTGDLKALFDAQAVASWMTGEKLTPHLGIAISLLLPLSIAAAVGLIVIAIWKRRWSLLFLPGLTAAMLLQMYLTPRPIWIHHWIGIFPFPHLGIGLVLSLLWQAAEGTARKLTALTFSAIVIVAVGLNLLTMSQFYRVMNAYGSADPWSDAIYPLSKTLEQEFGKRDIQVMDWGIFNQLYLLSPGRPGLFEPVYKYTESPEPDANLVRLVSDPLNVFVTHASTHVRFQNSTLAMMDAARRAGVDIKAERLVSDRRGEAIYRIIQFSLPGEKKEDVR
jgi:hypothetical protein